MLFVKILQYYVKNAFEDALSFSKKIDLWRKVWSSQKIKSVKNIIIKNSGTKIFQVCIIIIALFSNLALALVFALQCYFGDNVEFGLISKHLLQRKRQYGGWKNLTVTTKF